ncbi:MAG: hypothetical protein AAF471_09690 [Myxococcota bacterium]
MTKRGAGQPAPSAETRFIASLQPRAKTATETPVVRRHGGQAAALSARRHFLSSGTSGARKDPFRVSRSQGKLSRRYRDTAG